MKIYYIDYGNKKISKDHEAWWLGQGHEVKHDLYFDIEKAKWADVVICFWCEGQAAEMARAKKAGLFTAKTIVQLVDIDAYLGPWRGFSNDPVDGNLWNYIDQVVYMAQHIKEFVTSGISDSNPPDWGKKLIDGVVIPLPIDMHKYTYRERKEGLNIAFIAHMWSSKGIPMLYQFFSKLRHQTGKDYQLHMVGTKSNELWLHEYLAHIARELRIEKAIHYQVSVPDINEWLEDKDYLISTSYKDAFSLVVGEAMAKGIKTFLHNWWGSKEIWGDEYIWTTLDELYVKFTESRYKSNEYRQFVADRYSLEKVMPIWDKLL